MHIQIQEAKNTWTNINLKRHTRRHIIDKLKSQRQRENLENSERKATHHVQGSTRLSMDFFAETL